jgi:nucleoside-triphosphatase THEP1
VLILLSGPVRAGKTTLCLRLVARARERGWQTGGVLTPALVEAGEKAGIQAVELGSGETRLLARINRDLGGVRVGPYSFDDRVLEWVVRCCARDLEGSEARGSAPQIVFVDEIGKLELNRGGGLAPLIPLLARPLPRPTVVIVRDFLLEALLERFSEQASQIVMVDPACRERAWDALCRLALGPDGGEAGRC